MNKETCHIKPLGKYLFVRRVEAVSISKGGLFVPEQAKEKPQFGLVVATGAKVPEVAVGDVVLFGKYSGAEVDVLQEDILLMLEKDEVVGIVTDKNLIDKLLG